jgi:hypothetical protein
LIALASSRCLFAETAVIRLGTILPRSDTNHLQQTNVFVIDDWSVLAREGAALAAAKKWASHDADPCLLKLRSRRGGGAAAVAAIVVAVTAGPAIAASPPRSRSLRSLRRIMAEGPCS